MREKNARKGLAKLPGQRSDEAERIRAKTEELAKRAEELKTALRRERRLDVSAVLVVFTDQDNRVKPTREDRKLDLGEISSFIMQDISDLKRFLRANPEIRLSSKNAYVFPYGLPVGKAKK